MYSIGQFSKMMEVSTKTLRYYDEMGLFAPFEIDEVNGYRYYSSEQIDEFKAIKELKNYGLSLVDIKEITKSENKALLDRKLNLQISSIDREISKLEQMKKAIKIRIDSEKFWAQSNIETNYDIDEVEIDSGYVVFKKDSVELKNIGKIIGDLYEYIGNNEIAIRDGHYLEICNQENERADVYVFAFIDGKRSLKLDNTQYFDGGKCLRTIHYGISDKWRAYQAIYDYANENGIMLSNTTFEKNEVINGQMRISIFSKIS